ncbi:CheY chemotaxis protein or a CheY-like REC (receiver) domain [Algoriphagus alkaliphilus]|uniref:CheY chemotaxis protein or a CheY-like REC (Receiver) domain n=1 Tax=Algoriphagus alkaliphilus TaxID=279824 RepID=A0A1G5X0E0_9BACT|nr:response regulator [Algoriphagus alkaliphilus]MBA4301868.1 response regulator [Cyclobacterium sp.]SDA63247.1 CheY chemotaxis protein or a CheY-like REC (receiver) domain [Algoriphagus alkaliphilus]
MKVLLVDDDSIHLLILRKIFEKSNDEVVVAHNGKEALQYLEVDPFFHIIMTDIMMPVMDGVEFLEHLKESSQTCRIPTIGFTAGDVEYFREKCNDGFDSLVPKPMDFYDLYRLAKLTAGRQF